MNKLTKTDLQLCVSRIPKDVQSIMKEHGLYLGGGFIRSTIAHEKVNDIDLFGSSKEALNLAAMSLSVQRSGRLHKTDNAITVLSKVRTPAQLITRWMYDDPEKLCNDFDFTVCQSVIWFDKNRKIWMSCASDGFYPDLAAHRLVYTFPKREESAGGSLLRVRKFLQRGYNIQAWSLAGAISRLLIAVEKDSILAKDGEQGLTKVITGLLREVDPLVVIDGVEAVDEHEIRELEEDEK